MTTNEIILAMLCIALAIVNIVANFFRETLVAHQKKLLKDYYDRLDKVYAENDEVLLYCLKMIVNNAIDKEDYETAERANTQIKELTKQIQDKHK